MLVFLVGTSAAGEGNVDTLKIKLKIEAVVEMSFMILFRALPRLGAQPVNVFVLEKSVQYSVDPIDLDEVEDGVVSRFIFQDDVRNSGGCDSLGLPPATVFVLEDFCTIVSRESD